MQYTTTQVLTYAWVKATVVCRYPSGKDKKATVESALNHLHISACSVCPAGGPCLVRTRRNAHGLRGASLDVLGTLAGRLGDVCTLAAAPKEDEKLWGG